jgi:putative transposase
MIEKWYHKLENKYHDIRCHEMVVMPNHFHFIVENVGADLRVCPNNKTGEPNGTIDETKIGETKTIMGEHNPTMGEHNPTMGEHVGSPLPTVVQWFKTMTTNEYIRGVKTLGWQPFDGKLWQRNYWEHIIRNEQSYQRIANYIIENPKNWKQDKFFEE